MRCKRLSASLPLIASELEMSESLVRQYLEIIVDLAEIKKEEKR